MKSHKEYHSHQNLQIQTIRIQWEERKIQYEYSEWVWWEAKQTAESNKANIAISYLTSLLVLAEYFFLIILNYHCQAVHIVCSYMNYWHQEV